MSAIKSICQKGKEFILFEGNSSQWIGTKDCCFRVDDTIELTEYAIPDIFDLSDKKLEKIEITTMNLEESDLCPVGDPLDEHMMGEWTAVLSELGNQYKFLESKEHRLYMVDYNAIFGGIESGVYRRFYLMHNKNGDPVVALTDGMIITALLRPIDGKRMEMIQKGLRRLGFMQPGILAKEEEPEEEEDQQMEMDGLEGPEEEERDPDDNP